MNRRARLLALAVALHCGFAAAAYADRTAAELVADAKQELAMLRYAQVVELLEQAWRRGGNGRAELAAIFSLAGKASASMGKRADATLWFRRWLCLEPTGALPAGTSPKVIEPLDVARRDLAGEAIAARAIQRGESIEIEIVGDPLAMADAVRLGETRVALANGRAVLRARASKLELLDRHDNVLAELGVEAAAPLIAAERPRAHESPKKPRRRWVLFAVAGGVTALIGSSYAAYTNPPPCEPGTLFRACQAERDRVVRANWTLAGIFFGAAAVSAAGGVVFYIRDRPQRISVTPTAGGGAAAWTWQF